MHLLVQALLKAPGQTLNLLPAGEVSLRKMDEETVRGKAGTRKLSLYALSGLSDGTPDYYWQDAGEHFFVDSSVVPEGWEDILPQLRKVEGAQDQKLRHERATALTQHLEHALAIEHVRVFDPDRLVAKAGQTVLVSAGHIAAVGDDGSVQIPKRALRLDGHGRFLMAGLWDMHQHLHDDAGLLDLAAGITTVRDMGNPSDNLAGLVDGYESGADIGPRVIKVGLIDGRGPLQSRAGVYADTAEENAGIPPAEVLRLATQGAARVMKRDKEYGRIGPGYVSDLILVDGDPTINISDLRKVRTVLRGDRLYNSAALWKSMGIAPVP